MYNTRDIGHNYFESKPLNRSMTKKVQNPSVNDPRSDVYQNNNSFESLNDKYNLLSTRTEENYLELESKLAELELKLKTSCEEKNSLESQIVTLRKNFDSINKKIDSFSNLSQMIDRLTQENTRLSNEVSSLKKSLSSHNEMRDKEFNNQMTRFVEEVQKSVTLQIKQLSLTIEDSYDKKSSTLRDIITNIPSKESKYEHKDASLNYSYGNSSRGFENASDSNEEDGSSASSEECNSDVVAPETSPVKLVATAKKSPIKPMGDITTQNKPSIFSGLNMSSNKDISSFNITSETKTLFGSNQPIFNTNKLADTNTLFNTNKPTAAQTLFNTVKASDASSIFGTAKTDVNPSIFAGNKPSDSTKLFGINITEEKPTLFGGNKTEGKSIIFGLKSLETSAEDKTPISTTIPKDTSSIFGVKNVEEKPSLFGGKPSLFGSATSNTKSPLFGLVTKVDEPESQPLKEVSKPTICAPRILSNATSFTFGVQSKVAENAPIFGNGGNVPSFGSLAGGSEKGFGSVAETTWQSGSKLFSKTPSKDEGDSVKEDEEHDPEFKPIIELPPLIEIVRDDDQKKVLFKSRCKLYRFINNEWKERGVGDMKILQSVHDGVVTMVMRREQVHKICCNQRVTRDSHKMAPMGNDKSACWQGPDFSEGESSVEKFAVKFGDKAMMDEFTKVIVAAQAGL